MKKPERIFLMIIILFSITTMFVFAKFVTQSETYTVEITPGFTQIIGGAYSIPYAYIEPETLSITNDCTYTVPVTGYYLIQLWGANGSDAIDSLGVVNYGGDGGTINGVVYLYEGDTLNIYIGAKGQDGNDGGDTKFYYTNTYSDSSLISSPWDNLLMAAYGGGGASEIDYYPYSTDETYETDYFSYITDDAYETDSYTESFFGVDGSIIGYSFELGSNATDVEARGGTSYAASGVLIISEHDAYLNDMLVTLPNNNDDGYAVIAYIGSTYPQ